MRVQMLKLLTSSRHSMVFSRTEPRDKQRLGTHGKRHVDEARAVLTIAFRLADWSL